MEGCREEHEQRVLEWIGDHFHLDHIEVREYSLFPCGKWVTDQNGETMIVFWDMLDDRISYVVEN
ncbi:hypothetical protein HUG15_07185 [Salicibibacter cibarius]|uniref:Uncharacterized protein n=1 Tax=Salicibibacter cibarius TaxID=2743000 RepID=A0A7T6Z1R1_9BACI|nr:hypothetical protein [Salicibibacter cibarius]QQK75390.1 hypothetical protein HUG15_07185 [Salicibibacter cibarius]